MHLPAVRLVALSIAVLVCISTAGALAGQDKKLNRRDIEKLVAEADKLTAEGQLAEARQRLNTVVQQDPANAAVALKLARVCDSLKDWNCVATAYQLALAGAAGA